MHSVLHDLPTATSRRTERIERHRRLGLLPPLAVPTVEDDAPVICVSAHETTPPAASNSIVVNIVDLDTNDTEIDVEAIHTDSVIVGAGGVHAAIVNYEPLTQVPRIAHIQGVVARAFGISVPLLLSQRRSASLVRPRHIAMYLAKTLTQRSLPEIGRRFGGRDHTTAIHAVRKIERLLHQEPDLPEQIENLKNQIMGTGNYVANRNGMAGRTIAAVGETLGG